MGVQAKGEAMNGMTRRDFIKGLGALALIPFIPEMVKPERSIGNVNSGDLYVTASDIIRKRQEFIEGFSKAWTDDLKQRIEKRTGKPFKGIKWDNTGTMTIPTRDGRYKVKYTVHPDSTEAEIVGDE